MGLIEPGCLGRGKGVVARVEDCSHGCRWVYGILLSGALAALDLCFCNAAPCLLRLGNRLWIGFSMGVYPFT